MIRNLCGKKFVPILFTELKMMEISSSMLQLAKKLGLLSVLYAIISMEHHVGLFCLSVAAFSQDHSAIYQQPYELHVLPYNRLRIAGQVSMNLGMDINTIRGHSKLVLFNFH
jgi:hypothetical protein